MTPIRRPVLLVIGSSGQVGRQLTAHVAKRSDVTLLTAARSDPIPARRFNLEHPESVTKVVDEAHPDHIVLAAAATNVAWCEEHAEESRRINVDGTEAVAVAARRIGATLTFLSTDYVFDGSRGPNGEVDEPDPINVYGAHKLEAETAVLGTSEDNIVIRSCQVFGDDPRRQNFVLRVVDLLAKGEVVEVAGDLFGTPTYAPDLARAVVDLTLRRQSGVWHAAGESFLSRYELAKRVAVAFQCASGTIAEVWADQMNDPVNRPRRAGLRNDRLLADHVPFATDLNQALAELAAVEGHP